MEGNTHLLQVIRQMRSQIDRLEQENQALRGELRACGLSAAAGGGSGEMSSTPCPTEGLDASPTAPMDQADTTMTVRRYSSAVSVPSRPHRAGKRAPSSGQRDVQGRAEPHACPTTVQYASNEGGGLGKSPANCFSSSSSSKMRLFQEHVHRCRGKVKAVSFLLPVDVSYAETQGSFKGPQNQDRKQSNSSGAQGRISTDQHEKKTANLSWCPSEMAVHRQNRKDSESQMLSGMVSEHSSDQESLADTSSNLMQNKWKRRMPCKK